MRIWPHLVIMGAMGVGGCVQHTVEVKPLKVEPIHVTVDLNIKIDRQLDEFFAYEKAARERVEPSVEPNGSSNGQSEQRKQQ